MSMGLLRRGCLDVLGLMMGLLLLKISLSYGSDTDIACLQSIKDSIEDPNGYLRSWNFNNKAEGFICAFVGIECWHPDENRVLNIKLSGMGLKGAFPRAVANCTSLTGLDLSFNVLAGEIPSDISRLVPYVSSLVLSSNSFFGEIPTDLSDCSFLNKLLLDDNKLSGQIPAQIGKLDRLHTFSVANNDLVGPIPSFLVPEIFTAESFANNLDLCGPPLASCPPEIQLTRTAGFISGAATGGVIFFFPGFAIGVYFFIYHVPNTKKKKESPKGKKWPRSIRWSKQIKVSISESTMTKAQFRELMKATDNFSKDHIIGFGRTGTLYRAALKNGSIYTVKRSQYTRQLHNELALKMTTLGSVRHLNLVPLLGYCVANKEQFMVYEHMPNGSLYDQLHSSTDCSIGEWPLIRLKIAVGAARGLTWLHHNCMPRIIHQNISSRCILLDADFVPKISDFGLVTLKNPINEHSSNYMKMGYGDSGYLAPEHARSRVTTPKRDVYSFGIVLLELITGEKPTFVAKASDGFEGNLVEWVMQLSSNSRLEDAVDRCLVGKGFDSELFEFLKVACNCVASDPNKRPSMSEVYQLLTAVGDQSNVRSLS